LIARGALRELSGRPDQRFWILQELESLLEAAALEQPLLVAIDDVHWADPASLSVLRTLPARLTSSPIVWLLAHRPGEGSGAFRDALAASGAERLVLEPLGPDPVAQMVADILGGRVGPAVLDLAARAQGNPFLLVELLAGLVEEELVHEVGGRIELPAGGRLPDRLTQSMRSRLDRLSSAARDAVEVASVLGRRFSAQDLAGLLDRSPAALLTPLQEALGADLLSEDGERLVFRHDLIREAVHDALPKSARDALHRQAADMLLARGASPVEAAAHLGESAQPGDRAAIDTLRDAAAALSRSSPSSAADFSLRALELIRADDVALGSLRAETTTLLLQAGRVAEAKAMADRALEGVLSPEEEGAVRLSLARLFARRTYACAAGVEECRRGLALDGLSPALRADLETMLAHCLMLAGRIREASAAAEQARAAARAAGRPSAEAVAIGDLSIVEYVQQRWLVAAEHVDEAVALPCADGAEELAFAFPKVWQTFAWASLDRIDEALGVATTGMQRAQQDGRADAQALWLLARCRLLYDAGRLTDARAEAEALLATATDLGVGNFGEVTALYVLARVAVRTGDRRGARAAVDAGAGLGDDASAISRCLARLAAGVVADSDGDPEGAVEVLAPAYDALAGDQPVLAIPEDPTDQPWLVRVALRAGHREKAETAARAAERRAELNPGVASLDAAAAHARALLDDDADALRHAVERHRESPRSLGRASALEDAGRVVANIGERDEAVRHLDEALALYAETGASRDAARVRRRLRDLGIRRRLVAPARPTHGWDALTDSEIEVVRVVAAGATNREAAERLFVSPHTVSSHLRSAFAKLDINSRVELARIAVEAEQDPVPDRRHVAWAGSAV
jgi:DNA-binding CsgD family transcriptional regulator